MHKDGEIDTRSIYTCLAVARILNILTPGNYCLLVYIHEMTLECNFLIYFFHTELCEGVADYVLTCQTYEGGFGGEPFNEAHGGYNFCALAALLILGHGGSCDVEGQKRWLQRMQTQLEGGFRGRTNKLVDACYSFWQGGAFAVLRLIEMGMNDCADCAPGVEQNLPHLQDVDMNSAALQKYIIHCAQQPEGGLRGNIVGITNYLDVKILLIFLTFALLQTNLEKDAISIIVVML